MKTVQQIMEEGNAQANIQNFRYMQENYTYDQKVRHAENVAASFEEDKGDRAVRLAGAVQGDRGQNQPAAKPDREKRHGPPRNHYRRDGRVRRLAERQPNEVE
ncbi:MAG: hypothetical protein ACLTX9_09205 [Oscillospiraceae bacterium]